ncbi:hypothetical protein PSENEW3n2_00005385 [Picochlorum sp. SENEW3]|nr:hypothetical protein PSENEW3n2_00005385 [Picochlorum sp. SENEW3]WPT17380.1 hypothetical protein PSENEW3_00005385 [Picochlorum sp. SENEW3]
MHPNLPRLRLLSRSRALLVPLLCIIWAHEVVNTPTVSAEHAEREATLGGMCFTSTVSDEATLRGLRRQHVKFNLKKSMYRDGDVIAIYKLDRPGHGSLAGCADACLLNWRLTDDTSQALDTDCSLQTNSHCPMTSGVIVADRKCEAFMFNRQTSVCTLLSAEQSMTLTRSSNFWSGKVVCEDMTSVDDWAEGVVSRRSPPPPPPSGFYLASNGVTVKCPLADVGDTGVVDDVTYTKRTRDQIIDNNLDLLLAPADVASTCTSGITDMSGMFYRKDFNQDIGSWDTSSVTNMAFMFFNASSFDQDIGSWDVSSVTDMRYMFAEASSFNQILSSWDASALEEGNCFRFALGATAWLNAYEGGIAGKNPPLSDSMIAAICGFDGAN